MELSLLPQEICEQIISHLNLRDVLACCLVSIEWRNTINSNRIWNKLCYEKFGLQIGTCELISNNNSVSPAFAAPENHFHNLTDICKWRIRFMQETFILKNWRGGRYVTRFVSHINMGETLESDKNTIVIPDTPKRIFTPWRVEDNINKKSTVPYSVRNMLASFFKLSEDKVVVTQCTLLQIFSKTKSSDFILKYRFLFNKPFEDSKNIPITSDITDWYNSNVGLYPCDISMCCDHNGEYFVGVLLEGNLNYALLHIWNISNGIKCTELKLPSVIYNVIDIRFTIHNSRVFLFLQVEINNNICTQIYCIDLNSFTYTDLIIQFDYVLPIVLVRDPYLFTVDTSGADISIWRIINGELVHRISNNYFLNPMAVQLASSCIIFCGASSNSDNVKVFNTKTLKTLHDFRTGFKIINLTMVRTELMLIRGKREFGLWDISSGTKLYTINKIACRQVVWTNDNFSKIAVETENNELYILYFW